MNREEIIMEALKVCREDAIKIIEHLTKHDCIFWVDDGDPLLVDVHWENSFEDMIDWQYEDSKPSEMLGKSTDINDYPEMLKLKDSVIFWYGLV